MPEELGLEIQGDDGTGEIQEIDLSVLGSPEDAEPEGDAIPEPVDAEPEKKIPDTVPYDRFQEVYQESKQAKAAIQQLAYQNQQLMAAFQQLQGGQQQQRKAVDPEVQAFLDVIRPGLDEYIAPVLRELQATKQTNVQLQNKAISEAAWNYVQTNVPDLNEIAPDLMELIDSRRDKDAILADPDRVVDLAELVRLRKNGPKPKGPSEEVRKVSRSQAKAEVPNTQPRTSIKDWNSVSQQEFDAVLRNAGF
jgi:hypothetical protein